jgi:HD-like signal output (HDOD) protein
MLDVNKEVLSDIERGFSVPAQPDLLVKLQQLMATPEPDLNKIASIISQDVAVSSAILKTINSPIYGLARTISDIPKSVRYIGINGIFSLVSNILIRKSFTQDKSCIALEAFWDSATNIANASVYIGQRLKHAVSKEKLFTLALFHDCGIPVMASRYDDYNDIYQQAFNTPSKSLPSFEEAHYKVNHATIGFYVASSWRLPKDICQLILSHHDAEFFIHEKNRLQKFYFAVLKLAENIVHNCKHFRDESEWPLIQEMVFTVLNIDEDDYQDFVEDLTDLQI